MKRYFIHRYQAVTWTLVFDAAPGRWFVEKTTAQNSGAQDVVRLSLEEFEKTDFGQQLRDRVAVAVRAAENDV